MRRSPTIRCIDRIYTLDNGLKVYMTVNGEAPRIQTYIAVRVGSKNDPLETTGLAHYFEHLMFKGTKSFGTQDYEAERPMLDEIENVCSRSTAPRPTPTNAVRSMPASTPCRRRLRSWRFPTSTTS